MKNENYATLTMEPETYHNCGFLYSKNNLDFLVNTSNNGFIRIWNLFNKSIAYSIDTNESHLYYITPWSMKYSIATDFGKKAIKIIDLEEKKVIKIINEGHTDGVVCVKKIIHPIYGESLVSAGGLVDNKVILWTS